MSKIDELRPLAEIFWKFHNDRLEDPSIKEMSPYLNEFITWRDRAVLRGKIEVLEEASTNVIEPCEENCTVARHARHEGSWNAHKVIENQIEQLEAQLEKLEEK